MRFATALNKKFPTTASRVILVLTLVVAAWGIREVLTSGAQQSVRQARRALANPPEEMMDQAQLLASRQGELNRLRRSLNALESERATLIIPTVDWTVAVIAHLGDSRQVTFDALEQSEQRLSPTQTLVRWQADVRGEHANIRQYLDHVGEIDDEAAIENIVVTSDPTTWPILSANISVVGLRHSQEQTDE